MSQNDGILLGRKWQYYTAKRGGKLRNWAAFLILSAAECIMLTIYPALNLIIIILWGATLVLAAVYLNRGQLISIYLVNLAVLYFILGIESTIVFMLFFGIAGLAMSYLAGAGRNYYEIQKYGMIAALIGVSFFLVFFYSGGGASGSAQLEKELNSYMETVLDDFVGTDLFQIYAEQGVTEEEVKSAFENVALIISKHLPAFYYLQAIMAVFFMLFLAHLAGRIRSNERLKKKPYSQEIMPWQLVWVLIAGIGLWLWGKEGTTTVYYVGSNILVIMIPVAIYYGLSVALHVLNKLPLKRKPWFIIMIILVVIVFTPPIIILLSLLGVFDALLDFRKIRLSKEV